MERKISKIIGSYEAMVALLLYSAVWFVVEGANIGLDGFATIFGLFLVMIVQRSQNRDTTQMITLLDTLVVAVPEAADELAHLDEADIKRIEKIKKAHLGDAKPA